MKIYNTTTKETAELTIIDSKSGIEWTNDLLGNNGALNYNEELEMAEMDQDDFDWWSNLIDKMQANDDLILEIESSIRNQEDLNEFREGIYECVGNDLDVDTDRIENYLGEYQNGEEN